MIDSLHGRTGANRDAETDRDESMESVDDSPLRRVHSIGHGLVGGAFATLVMTVFRVPIAHSLPPTARFWATYVGGGEPEDYPFIALVLHLAYGVASGGLYGFLFESGRGQTRAGIEIRDLVRAVGFSICLSLFGSHVILSKLLGMDLDRDESLMFHVGHLVYGLALGAWVGSNR